MTPAAKMIEQVRVIMNGQRGRPFDDASPWRLEVGRAAQEALSSAAGWLSTHRVRLLPVLYSLPVESPDGIGDRAWRIRNRHGDVIAEGEITDR